MSWKRFCLQFYVKAFYIMLPLISLTDVLKDTGTFPRTNTLECKIRDNKVSELLCSLNPENYMIMGYYWYLSTNECYF